MPSKKVQERSNVDNVREGISGSGMNFRTAYAIAVAALEADGKPINGELSEDFLETLEPVDEALVTVARGKLKPRNR